MHQRIGVDDENHKGRHNEEGEKRQFDIEERQFDGPFKQQIRMGNRARRDRDIGENKEIREPEPAADGGGVLDRFFDLFEIVGLRGDSGKGRFRHRARCRGLGRRLCFEAGFLVVSAHLASASG
jgi:hypothetical protein